jgi:hypothetical protein
VWIRKCDTVTRACACVRHTLQVRTRIMSASSDESALRALVYRVEPLDFHVFVLSKFVDNKCFVALSCVCRAWRDAAAKSACRNLALTVQLTHTPLLPARSAFFRRHLSHFKADGYSCFEKARHVHIKEEGYVCRTERCHLCSFDGSCDFNVSPLAEALAEATNLRTVCIHCHNTADDNYVDDGRFATIVACILSAHAARTPPNSTRIGITHISLRAARMDVCSMRIVASIIASSHSLLDVNLSDNDAIHADSAAILAAAVAVSRTLVNINLTDTPIDNMGAVVLIDAFIAAGRVAKISMGACRLNMACVRAITDRLVAHPNTFSHVSLGHNYACRDTTDALMDALRYQSGSLREIDMNGSKYIGEEAVQSFASMPLLESINLYNCDIDGGYAIVLKRVVTACKKLHTLNVGHSSTVDGMRGNAYIMCVNVFAAAIAASTSLTNLHLKYFDFAEVAMIARAVAKSTSIVSLSLGYDSACFSSNGEEACAAELMATVRKCRTLTRLDMNGSKYIGEEAVQSFASMPLLESITWHRCEYTRFPPHPSQMKLLPPMSRSLRLWRDPSANTRPMRTTPSRASR